MLNIGSIFVLNSQFNDLKLWLHFDNKWIYEIMLLLFLWFGDVEKVNPSIQKTCKGQILEMLIPEVDSKVEYCILLATSQLPIK
jgi:hypothetical protein